MSNFDLAAHASIKALAQVGLKPSDVDGLFCVVMDETLSGLNFAEYLGVRSRFNDNARTGGSSFQIQASVAALALATGQCDVALIAYGSNQRSALGKLATSARSSPWEAPYKPLRPISSYAMAAARHMHQFGTTKEQLGEVAIAARKWAQLNPDAFSRDELTMEAYLAARMVADPLGVRDCCLVTDGAAAVVMTRADRARDLCKRPAYLLGAAHETTHREIAGMPDLTVTGVAEASRRAFAQAGITAADVDVVELYDAFTINTILFLEDMGFCAKGEGGSVRLRRQHRARWPAAGEHQRRRAVVLPPRHVRALHDGGSHAADHGCCAASARSPTWRSRSRRATAASCRARPSWCSVPTPRSEARGDVDAER